MVWVHPKTAKKISSTNGALVGSGSLRPINTKLVLVLDYFSHFQGIMLMGETSLAVPHTQQF
jgi:hypothetical protein